MRMIRPKLVAPQVTIAEDQAEFLPVTAALVNNREYDSISHCTAEIRRIEDALRRSGMVVARREALEPLEYYERFGGRCEFIGLRIDA